VIGARVIMHGDYKARTSLKALSRPHVFTIMPLYFYEKYASLGHDGYTTKDTSVCQAFMPKRGKGDERRDKSDSGKKQSARTRFIVITIKTW